MVLPLTVNLGRHISDALTVLNYYRMHSEGDCVPCTAVQFPDGTIHAPMILYSSQGSCKKDEDEKYYVGVPTLAILVEDPDFKEYVDIDGILELYKSNGILEVILNHTYLRLVDGDYTEINPDSDGIIKSQALANLHWSMKYYQQSNWLKMIEVIDRGLEERNEDS